MNDALTWVERVGGWSVIFAATAVVFALVLLRRLLARPKASPHVQVVRCPACAWTGSVSKYKPVCPRCARSLQP